MPKRWWLLHQVSLRYQVAAAVAVGTLILFAILGYLSLTTTQRTANIVYMERLRQAETAAASIDALVSVAVEELEHAAGLEVFASREALAGEGARALEKVIHIMFTYDTLWLTDASGKIVTALAAEGEPDPIDFTEQAFFRNAIASGTTVVGEMDVSGMSHPPVAVVVVPLREPGGEVYGAVVGSLHLAHMGVNLVSLPRGGESFLAVVVNQEGMVMATSVGPDIFYAYPEPHTPMLRPLMEQRKPGVLLHEVGGAGHVVAYAPLRQLQGGVILEERRDIALAILGDLRRTFLGLGLAALILASVGAWLHARSVTRPIEVLDAATRRIAAGALDTPVASERGDEIGMLARSFDSMRLQLKSAREERLRWEHELESRVRERTQEVHQLLGKIISAQEEERKRLARELHDETAQTLATLLLGFQTLYNTMPPEHYQQREMLGRALAQGEAALRDIRRTIQALRPSSLDDMGLVAALRAYAEERLSATGVALRFDGGGGERRLDSSVETALFRILQEAVTNVVKHSKASSASIRLQFGRGSFVGEVIDDGMGFNPETVQASAEVGLGLQGMRERADLIGARLEIHSQPGGGTRVRVELPLEEGNDEHG